jgi:hypothetical protein
MKFGLFYEWPNPTLRNWKTLFEEGVEQIQYSEEVGFDYCLIAEHHFSKYGNSSSPLLQALYIGQRHQAAQNSHWHSGPPHLAALAFGGRGSRAGQPH